MKHFVALCLVAPFAFAELEVEGFVGIDTQFYSSKENKHSNNITLEQQLKLKYEKDQFSSVVEIFAQEDTKDFLSSSQDNKRSFLRVNEAYMQYEMDDSKVLLGKNIKFWGALEVLNIVDTFNIQDKRNDPFKTDKIGAYSLEYSYYFEDSELSIITKLYEQKNKMASSSYMYIPLQGNDNLEDKLDSEKSLYRPSVYINYNGSLYGDYSLDYAFIYENGYDSQRYLSKNNNTFTEHAYLVNKFMTYNTMVVDSTLVKFEGVYADVINDKNVSDYIHLALGAEHTLEQLDNGNEIGLIGEYYYYKTLDKNKLTDLQLAQSFQNDLFLGLRYSFNDVSDSSAVGGVILDTKYNEQSYYIEYKTRINDIFNLKFDYRYIEPSDTHNTVYKAQGQHQRAGINLSYHF